MPSVLDRSALEQSPLADLHLLANELGVDGFRRLRKEDLVDAILSRQGGEEVSSASASASDEPVAAAAGSDDDQPKRSRRGRRGGRGRRREEEEGGGEDREDREERKPASEPRGEDRVVEGAVELLANGSGLLRLTSDPSDDDVYISAAQVKRCELVSGDRVAGPMRAARRSERYPSLIRVDTINGRPAEEVAEGTRFEELAVAWPNELIVLGGNDPTLEGISNTVRFGKGSRVVIAGPSRSGKSEALRRIAGALAGNSGLEVSAVLVGVRPEEITEFPVTPGAALNFSASVDAQTQAIEQAVEVGRRVAARGGDAVVLIDTLEYLPASAARRALAAGRNLAGAGSLTLIATAPEALGGETTVIALGRTGTFPSLIVEESGTLRPELLVEAPPAPEPVVEARPRRPPRRSRPPAPASVPRSPRRRRPRRRSPPRRPRSRRRRQEAGGRGEEARGRGEEAGGGGQEARGGGEEARGRGQEARGGGEEARSGGGQEAGRGQEAGGEGQAGGGGEEAGRQGQGGGEEARRQAQAGRQEAGGELASIVAASAARPPTPRACSRSGAGRRRRGARTARGTARSARGRARAGRSRRCG